MPQAFLCRDKQCSFKLSLTQRNNYSSGCFARQHSEANLGVYSRCVPGRACDCLLRHVLRPHQRKSARSPVTSRARCAASAACAFESVACRERLSPHALLIRLLVVAAPRRLGSCSAHARRRKKQTPKKKPGPCGPGCSLADRNRRSPSRGEQLAASRSSPGRNNDRVPTAHDQYASRCAGKQRRIPYVSHAGSARRADLQEFSEIPLMGCGECRDTAA